MDIVLATRNPGKILEIKNLLSGIPVTLRSLEDYRDVPEVDEDRPTLETNAIKKAREVSTFLSMPAIADDTGLEVRALGMRPGVHSARYAGPEADPVANRALLLTELRGAKDRSAQFRTVAAFVSGSETVVFEGICDGSIALAESGNGGFGYDALFVPNGEKQTFAELPLESKNAVSHRGKALRKLAAFLLEHVEQ